MCLIYSKKKEYLFLFASNRADKISHKAPMGSAISFGFYFGTQVLNWKTERECAMVDSDHVTDKPNMFMAVLFYKHLRCTFHSLTPCL